MLTLLFVAFFVALYFAWRWWNGRYERAVREILRPKELSRPSLRTLTARLSLPAQLGRSSLHIWAAVILGIAGAVISRIWWHKTPVFGMIIGAAIPFLATAIWRRVYTQRYRKDVKTALLFAGAVFREGGTVETWIREVVDRLEGPLRKEFAFAAARINQQGVGYFLRHMAETSPDSAFRIAMAGIYDNYQSTGDMREFIVGILDSLRRQEHLERSMKQRMKQFSNMMSIPLLFPITMYLLFQPTIDKLLASDVLSNFVLLVGLAGYGAMIWAASRFTRPKLLD